jgi:hypothetical protein
MLKVLSRCCPGLVLQRRYVGSRFDVTPRCPVHNGGVRNLAPWALLVLLGVGGAAAAALGITNSHAHPAVPASDSTGTGSSQFVGLTVQQAEQLARNEGVQVRVWRLPTDAPAGTVLQEISSRPAFLVVSAGPPAHRGAALHPALGPPVRPVCTPGFRLDADGDAGPATCPDGAVNAAVWEYFAASSPPMLTLGRSATRCAVARAYDDEQLTAPMNFTVFELANAYNGWSFGPAFTDQLVNSGAAAGGCAGA